MRRIVLAAMLCANLAYAGTLDGTTLRVGGEPFFPIGTWGGDPAFCAEMGMNVALHTVPKDSAGIERFRLTMREFADHDVQVVAFLQYFSVGAVPWTREEIERAVRLASEPNLLAWYLGDDVYENGLPDIEQTSKTLRELTPDVPTAADYIGNDEDPEARRVYSEYVDIANNYDYPIPGGQPLVEPLDNYIEFFDVRREPFGEPRWTVIQAFQWARQSERYNLGVGDMTGAIPEPEQMRLLAMIALNRGVRGLLLWPYRSLVAQPELAAEWALVAREGRLVGEFLAAGEWIPDLTVSDENLHASAFDYDGSLVVVGAVVKPFYNRWVDNGVMEGVTIECPWESDETPRAVIVSTPDLIECEVSEPEDGMVTVTLPSFEVAGFVLVTADDALIESKRAECLAAADSLAQLAVPAAAMQLRESDAILRHAGRGMPREAMEALSASSRALSDGRNADVIRQWRQALRTSRTSIDGLMRSLEARRSVIPQNQQMYLESPHALRNIRGLGRALNPEDKWHFVTEWKVAGPFPLDWNGQFVEGNSHYPEPAPGFARQFAPEQDPASEGPFDTMDGAALWNTVSTDVAGMLDLTLTFATTDTSVAYAKVIVNATEDMNVTMSVGSNDGFKAIVNGEEVFANYCARAATPHQNNFPVKLRAGRNVVLVKVANLAFGWQVYVSFDDPDRRLQYSTD